MHTSSRLTHGTFERKEPGPPGAVALVVTQVPPSGLPATASIVASDLAGRQVPYGAERVAVKPAHSVDNEWEETDAESLVSTMMFGVLGACGCLQCRGLGVALAGVRVWSADVYYSKWAFCFLLFFSRKS